MRQTADLRTFSTGDPYAYPETAVTCGGGTHDYPLRFMGGGTYTITVLTPAEGNMKFRASLHRITPDASAASG